MTKDSSNREEILICVKEGSKIAYPCELTNACREHIQEVKKRER
ncbi:MAG: hypothetical protein WC325_13300 [Candidatus Bathyarchaeia archaeon]|jgi:hypothetical protein